MISSDAMRGYNDALILAILQQGDSYGYKIGKEIRERTDGQYLIRETTKPRTYYRITPSGRNFLAVKAAEWERVKTVVDPFLKQPLTNL